jgi:hypothetical protein
LKNVKRFSTNGEDYGNLYLRRELKQHAAKPSQSSQSEKDDASASSLFFLISPVEVSGKGMLCL